MRKKSGASPLSRYVATLREVAQQRNASLPEYSSVLVGEHSSVFGSKGRESDEDGTRDEEGTAVFSSSWLPGKDSKTTQRCEKKWKRKAERQDQVAMDEDIVQELVLSSDGEDGSLSDTFSAEEDEMEKPAPSKPKHSTNKSKQNAKPRAKRSKKRKTGN